MTPIAEMKILSLLHKPVVEVHCSITLIAYAFELRIVEWALLTIGSLR
jgi:hypothetical protein